MSLIDAKKSFLLPFVYGVGVSEVCGACVCARCEADICLLNRSEAVFCGLHLERVRERDACL